ncbi:MAG TPA: hypothetical protein VGC67_17430 [Cellulomonas sp.]
MLRPTRLLLRDGETRALLRGIDLRGRTITIEGTAASLRVADATTGAPLVDAPMAHLELIDSESIHYTGAGRVLDSRELRYLRITLEFSAPAARALPRAPR